MAEPITREDIAQIHESIAERMKASGTALPGTLREAHMNRHLQSAADTRHADQMPRLGVRSMLYQMSRGR